MAVERERERVETNTTETRPIYYAMLLQILILLFLEKLIFFP